MDIIFNIILNGIYIIEGYAVWIWNFITGKTKEKAEKRMSICNECEHNKKGICDICGCILKAKTRVDFPEDENGISIDGCPERKW